MFLLVMSRKILPDPEEGRILRTHTIPKSEVPEK